MLSALRKISETSKSPRRAVSVSNEPVEGNDLFEALVCEFHWTALQIGAITCCGATCIPRPEGLFEMRILIPLSDVISRESTVDSSTISMSFLT